MKRLEANKIYIIKRMAKEGYSLNRINKLTNIPKTTIYQYTKNIVRKVSKLNLENLSDWEKGYIVGLFVSDGCLSYTKKHGSYCVAFSLNRVSEGYISGFITKLLRKANLSPYDVICRNVRRTACISKGLYLYLKDFVLYKNMNGRFCKVDINNIKDKNTEFRLGFIGGYIDGDGCVCLDKNKYIRCLITTSKFGISENISKVLSSLNIKNTIYFNKKRRDYYIRLSTPYFKERRNEIACLKGPVDQR